MLKQIASRVDSPNELRVGRILCALGLILSLVLGAFIAGVIAKRPGLGWGLSLFLFVAVFLAGLYVAQAFYELEGWLEQHLRDVGANKIWAALKAGKPSPVPFTLYLRPFASTDHIGAEQDRFVRVQSLGTAGPGILAMGTDRLEFEAEVERALRPIGPLVALGKPLEHMGAGRVLVSDDEWKHAVERLMDEARLIVLLPSSRPGTTWEVKTLLAEGRLIKTIVVDPPDHLGIDSKTYDPSAEWGEVRQAFATHGFTLPPDDPEGLLLYFGAKKSPARKTKISMNGAGSVRAFAERVMQDIAAYQPQDPTIRGG